MFAGSEDTSVLVSVAVPIDRTTPLRPLVRRLERRLPRLRYWPSPHEPDVLEGVDASPVYVLERDVSQAILVKPREGVIYLSEIRCID